MHDLFVQAIEDGAPSVDRDGAHTEVDFDTSIVRCPNEHGAWFLHGGDEPLPIRVRCALRVIHGYQSRNGGPGKRGLRADAITKGRYFTNDERKYPRRQRPGSGGHRMSGARFDVTFVQSSYADQGVDRRSYGMPDRLVESCVVTVAPHRGGENRCIVELLLEESVSVRNQIRLESFRGRVMFHRIVGLRDPFGQLSGILDGEMMNVRHYLNARGNHFFTPCRQRGNSPSKRYDGGGIV
jgi:hypothetical protein